LYHLQNQELRPYIVLKNKGSQSLEERPGKKTSEGAEKGESSIKEEHGISIHPSPDL
jgi:hypothetical protein